METLENKTVGSTVALDYRTASVFQKYGIDFCCKGGQTIDEACQKKGLETNQILKDIENAINTENALNEDYNSWSLGHLADYIEQKHHRYVEEQSPMLVQFLDKLCKVHGGRHPELFEIKEEFQHIAYELAMHMEKEEKILFPVIRHMEKSRQDSENYVVPGFGTVQNPINMMMSEHSLEGDRLVKIATLSNDYTAPADGCTTYRVAFQMLKDFESDLHKHIHLENNILFPKSIALEKELN